MGRGLIILLLRLSLVWIAFLCDPVCITESSPSIGVWFHGGALAGEGRCWDDTPGQLVAPEVVVGRSPWL